MQRPLSSLRCDGGIYVDCPLRTTDQRKIWIDTLVDAKYELDTCIDVLIGDCKIGDPSTYHYLQSIMEQVEVTSRHLSNLSLEMKMVLKEKKNEIDSP